MREDDIRNLTSLSPLDEAIARVAISKPCEERLRLGLPAVIGTPDGRAIVIRPEGWNPVAARETEES